MGLFRPNLDCTIRKVAGRNVYGEEVLGQAVSTRCAIIELTVNVLKSSVRADSSATRGAAREITADGRILLPATVSIDQDDQIEVAGYKLRIIGIFPRHDLRGRLDHFEVTVMIWGKT